MVSIYEQPIEQAALPDTRGELYEEKMMLARNFIQFYFANLDYHNRNSDTQEIPESERDEIIKSYGQKFEQWYKSAEGKIALDQYVKNHTNEEIIDGKNKDVLIRSFMIFRNRRVG